MRSVKEHYAELDAAVALSKKISADNSGSSKPLPFIILRRSAQDDTIPFLHILISFRMTCFSIINITAFDTE